MTLNEMVAEARQKSRVHKIDQDDATVAGYLNEAILRFSEEVGGRIHDGYVTLIPLFTVGDEHGVKVKTDTEEHEFTLTPTTLDDVTGEVFSEALQTQIRAAFEDDTITVAWSASEWFFTITIPGATEISIEKPSFAYFDGTRFLGGEGTEEGEEYVTEGYLGYVPEGQLPAEFISALSARYEGKIMIPEMFERIGYHKHGSPLYYAVRDRRLRVAPYPRSSGYVHLLSMRSYKTLDLTVIPADPEDPESVEQPFDGDQEPDVPAEYQKALPYYAASMMAENRHEYEIADRMLGQFMKYVSWYRLNYGNDDTRIGYHQPSRKGRLRHEEVEM